MDLQELQTKLKSKVIEAAGQEFGILLEGIGAEIPPKTELGDLAFPVAFELAKRIKQSTGEKKNPREIAERLKTALEKDDSVFKAEVAGAGYLNLFYDRARFLVESIRDSGPKGREVDAMRKACVEHTSVNPNKAAHIGHVRNSVLGDTLIRILRAAGEEVEVQNYIDNTGVQVADVVVGFIHLRKMGLAEIKSLDSNLETSFDYYCWDLYAEVGKFYAESEENLKLRAETLHELERGEGEIYELADYVATRNVECILKTMERLDIRYDLLPRESEILHLHFWQKAFELMQERGVIRYENEGKNKGCWVMPFDSHSGTDEHDADKILVRSNGTVTYTGKDIAYQMWKLGLLGMDFFYQPFHTYQDGKRVWITRSQPQKVQMSLASQPPKFGHGEKVYNVIDSRQSYPQEVVKKGVATIFPEKGEAASIHLSYEMVALSPAAAEALGFKLSDEERKKQFIEMSGRKGLGVKADDLINRLEEDALKEVASRHPELTLAEQKEIAHKLAVGALRYFLLKFTRNTIIVFDFDEALSFEGETGAYCQNAVVRINSIFRKIGAKGEDFIGQLQTADIGGLSALLAAEDEVWALVALANRLDESITQAAQNCEPAILAKYAFTLAKAVHSFYGKYRISSAEGVNLVALASIAAIAKGQLEKALSTLGIDVPEKM